MLRQVRRRTAVGVLAAFCAACGGSTSGGTSSTSATSGSGSSGSSGLAGGSTSSGLALSSGGTSSSGHVGSSTSSGGSSATQASSGGSSSGVASSSGATTNGSGTSSSSTSGGSSSGSGSGTSSSSSGGFNDGGYASGTRCFTDSECASNLCKEVVENLYVCVTPCTTQVECPGDAGAFCEPVSVGSSNGYCIPGSPTTCANCGQDSDCGDLTEVCIPDPGSSTDAGACHPDCSLAGDAGCPSQYSCQPVTVNGTPRQLCMPGTPSCLDEIGGDCGLIQAAQSCTRANADGSCTGQRTCTVGTNRFSDCSATVPQQLPSCSSAQPPNCAELTAPSAVSTVTNCGSCGYVCPGNGISTDIVSCTNQACTFDCIGENYDPSGNPANGCNVAASPQGNHTVGTATYFGAFDCIDGDSSFSISGTFPSDSFTHESPAITGFDSSTGSAPDYWSITGLGGSFPSVICDNDLQLNVFLTGSSNPGCYQITINDPSYGVTTAVFNPAGEAQINPGDSSPNYGSGDTITIELSKTCSTPYEAPTFSSTNGHL